MGHIDERGRLWLVGRLKDVVRSGGENVAVGEVEQVSQASSQRVQHTQVWQEDVCGFSKPHISKGYG